MPTNPADLLPSAKDLQQKIAMAESEKAAQEMRRREAADAEKQALIDQFDQTIGAVRRGGEFGGPW